MIIRGGENISPPRSRGVPAHASRRQRGPGDRRAEREVRRGSDGLDQATSGHGRFRGGAGRVLPGADRPFQGAAFLEVRRGVPDDGRPARCRSSRCASRPWRNLGFRQRRKCGRRDLGRCRASIANVAAASVSLHQKPDPRRVGIPGARTIGRHRREQNFRAGGSASCSGPGRGWFRSRD